MAERIKKTLFQWASTHNLNLIVNFHNELRRLLGRRVLDLSGATNIQKSGVDAKVAKAIYEDFGRLIVNNTFLMMYSYLEEWLHLSWKDHAGNYPLPQNEKGSIRRYKAVLKNEFGLPLSAGAWQVLMDAEKVRHCLLHANGRISLLAKSRDLENIVRKNSESLSIDQDRIRLGPTYVKKISEAIRDVMNTIQKSA